MTEQSEPRPLRLLVVDDHEVVRQGLVALIDRREKFQVVAEAGSVEELRAVAARLGFAAEALRPWGLAQVIDYYRARS